MASPATRVVPPPPDTDRVGRWVLAVTILGSGLVIIDVTAMNVVAPQIQRSLDTSVAAVQWVIEAYTLFLASVTLTGGALADRYGRRRIFGLGAVVFGLASLACGLAPSATTLIIARGTQGLGGALMLPGSLALIGAHFPVAERGRAIGLWASMAGLTAVLGPVLGGILSDLGDWRWIFFLNVPIVALLLVPLALKVPESRRQRRAGALDLTGALLATLGLGGITYGLIQAGIEGWGHPTAFGGLGAGGAVFLGFLLHQARTAHPMLDLRLFRDRTFAAANAYTLFLYAALAAGMFFVPMRLILTEDWSPTQAGFAMAPTILLISLLSPRFGSWTDRIGARPLLVTGAAIAATGFFVLGLPGSEHPYLGGILWGLILVGLGMSMVIAPLTTAVLAAVPPDEVGLASGVNNAISRLGALLAIAVTGIIAIAAFGHHLAPALEALDLSPALQHAAWTNRIDLAAAEPPSGADGDTAQAIQQAYDAGFRYAYRAVQWSMAGTAATGALIALLLPRIRQGAPDADPQQHQGPQIP